MTLNGDLVMLFRRHLLREFGQHGSHDPWWWPVEPANRPEYWGLAPTEHSQFASLCSAPKKPRRTYPRFGGSLSATPGCIFIVGERPSLNPSYASAVTKLHDCLRNFLDEGHRFHITDAIKFRGAKLTDNLTGEMVRISAKCLTEEIDLLRPVAVVLTSMTPKAIRALKDEDCFETIRRGLLDHPRREDVPFWSSQAFPDWQLALRRLVS